METLKQLEEKFKEVFIDRDEYVGHVHRDTTGDEIILFYRQHLPTILEELVKEAVGEEKAIDDKYSSEGQKPSHDYQK